MDRKDLVEGIAKVLETQAKLIMNAQKGMRGYTEGQLERAYMEIVTACVCLRSALEAFGDGDEEEG